MLLDVIALSWRRCGVTTALCRCRWIWPTATMSARRRRNGAGCTRSRSAPMALCVQPVIDCAWRPVMSLGAGGHVCGKCACCLRRNKVAHALFVIILPWVGDEFMFAKATVTTAFEWITARWRRCQAGARTRHDLFNLPTSELDAIAASCELSAEHFVEVMSRGPNAADELWVQSPLRKLTGVDASQPHFIAIAKRAEP